MSDKQIELLARCLDDLLRRIGYPQQREIILECQNYIIVCILNKLNDDIKRKIRSDEILYELVYGCPYQICPGPGDTLNHPTRNPSSNGPIMGQLVLNHLYSHNPQEDKKYLSFWKQIYNFLQEANSFQKKATEKWWMSISPQWMSKIALKFNYTKHRQRQQEKEAAMVKLNEFRIQLPDEVKFLIITYL